jgi:multicomponent Na+:H+ antiporter subunit F
MAEFGALFLDWSILFAYGAMIVSVALTVFRLLRGPTPADRVVALDMLALLGIGFIGIFSISTGEYAFLDVAIALALVGFLATVAFARYVYRGAIDARHARARADTGDEA